MASPVADLSYRDVEAGGGPGSPGWLVLARMGWRSAFSKRAFWVLTVVGGWYYLILLAILYFIEQANLADETSRLASEFFGRIVWRDQFLHGFAFSHLVWLSIALLLGAGAIANDNRANALLVYLSKPCRKVDYLFGKWLGVFVPLCVAMGLPMLVFFAYCVLNFRERGFFDDDPLLLGRVLVLVPMAAAFHTSIVIGISSLFNQGRLAGAAYAGLYFISGFFSQLMLIIFLRATATPLEQMGSGQAQTFFYLSVDGLLTGLAKVLLATDGTPPFGIPARTPQIAAPDPWMALGGVVLVAAVAVFVAWRRIRAVEVVK